MADRFTIDDAERALERLCKMVGKHYVPRKSSVREVNIGDWYLDKASTGNYVRVVQHGEHYYSQSLPMGATFYTYKDFVASVRFTADALSNCWVVTGEGTRGYPAGTLEPVSDDEVTNLCETNLAEFYDQLSNGWLVVKPLTVEQPSETMQS